MRILKTIYRMIARIALLACTAFAIATPSARAQSFDTVLNTNLFQPASVAVSPKNLYLIADTANNRIVQFNPDNRAFSVVAGPDRAPFEAGAVDGQRIDARFRNPQGLIAIGDKIYVADTGNHAIREIDSAGNVRTIAGDLATAHQVDDFGGQPQNWGLTDGPAATALFNGPCGLAYDGAGHLYIADSGNHAVRVLDLNANTVTTLVRSGLSTPVGLALASNGAVFISDAGAHSIKIWRPGDTKATLVAGGGSPLARGFRNSSIATNALFSAPGGIYYREATDELIVADSGNGLLRNVQNASTTSAKVETFANTDTAGFQTPIAVTRDLYGVFLVVDSTRNALASVITVKFPRIVPPKVGYITVIVDTVSGQPIAKIVPVADTTFDNFVRIAVSGDETGEHHYTALGAISDSEPLPLPTTNSSTIVNFQDPQPAPPEDVLNSLSLNSTLQPKYTFRLKVFTSAKGADERIPSLTTEAVFRFKCATPQIDSQSVPGRLLFRCNTTNAVIYYTMDGTEPSREAPTAKYLRSGESVALVLGANAFTVKARAYQDSSFLPSDVAKAEFTPDNFTPNRISLGFADGEASSYMRAAPGQRFFAPITLSLMPNVKAYGLQFDVSLEPLTAPSSPDYQMSFDSHLVEKFPETNRTIPPSVFVLAGTNFVTNFVTSIATNYTYEGTVTNYSTSATTNYLSLTNQLPEFVSVVTSTLVTNLGQFYSILTTNYITNSFRLVADNSVTNSTVTTDTNYLYRYTAPGVTNLVRTDEELPEATAVIVTNFVSNLGKLFSFNTTNYITNSFNLVSSSVVHTTNWSTNTTYTYQAATPPVTNFVSVDDSVVIPDRVPVIVTNFVENLGQRFPVVTTNILTNSFDFVSRSTLTTHSTNTETTYSYRAVTPGSTNIVVHDEILADSTPVVVTNFVQNLGQTFPVLSTNYISNSFNLIAVNDLVHRTTNSTTNFVYEVVTPDRVDRLFTSRLLPDSLPVVVTNFVSSLGEDFPIYSTNYIDNVFDLISADYQTNTQTVVTGNYLYRLSTAAENTTFVLDHLLPDKTPVLVTNFVSNLGEQFPVVRTNYITNSFNLVSASITTNDVTTVTTNFEYQAVTPGTTNLLYLTRLLPPNVPVVTTNFIENLGERFPVAQTNYLDNSFELLSAEITTNINPVISTSVVYRSITPRADYYVTLDRFLPDMGPVVTPITLQNQGIFYTLFATNYSPNIFELVSSSVKTTIVNRVIYDYVYSPVAVTNYLLWPSMLADGTEVVTTNQLILGNRSVQLAVTNTLTAAENFVAPVIDHGAIRYLYNFTNATPAGTLTVTAPLGAGPEVQLLTTGYITNLDQTFEIGLVQLVPNPIVATFVSTNVIPEITTSAVYRTTVPAITNYLTLSTNLPDVAPVVSTTTLTNLGQSYTLVVTNYATNRFEFVSRTLTTNTISSTVTNAVYRSVTAPVTNFFSLAAKLPDSTPVVTTTFLTNMGQLFPIVKTNYVANWFDFLGENHITKTETVVKTNATYVFSQPGGSAFISLSELLPDSVPVVTTNIIVNLGREFPVLQTNYLQNSFQLVSSTFSTNLVDTVTTNIVYEFRVPGATNYVFWPERLPDVVPVVTTNFVSNLGQLFPFAVTNYLTNTFRLAGTVVDSHETATPYTEVLYSLVTPSLTNYLELSTKLPDSVYVVTTNFINNLGQQFPVPVTNIVHNTFELLATNVITTVTDTTTTNKLYALRSAGVTNLVELSAKLPDFVNIITTNFITNLAQVFPVTVTNKEFNQFTLLSTNLRTDSLVINETNIIYEFHTPAVTNLFSLSAKLPDFIEVISTNFVTNLGQLFPVATTNLTENIFDLIATNYTSSTNTEVKPSFLYAVTVPASASGAPSVTTNLITLDEPLPDSIPIVSLVGFLTNLNQTFPVYSTNYLSNSFRLVSRNYITNNYEIGRTNASGAFANLVITNYLQSWMAVGWIERFGQTNLYNTKQQHLLSYSQAHNTLFVGANGEAVAGAFSFRVPTNATDGNTYKLRITRPSATADGVSQDMFIQAPDDTDTNSPVKAVRTLTVTNSIPYLVGDVSDFRWFNAGEFGDGNILNNDMAELQQVVVYGLNLPPQDSDFLDAMDTCCYTVDGRDLSSMQFATGAPINLDDIAFGDGSRPAPLGNAPYAKLEVNDLFLAYHRAQNPNLVWYERYWSNGVRQARMIPNTFRGNSSGLSRQSVSGSSLATGPTVQSDQLPALTVYAGAATGWAGQTVAVPVHARVDGGYALRTLMFTVRVESEDGYLVDTFSIEPASTDALGLPSINLNNEPGVSGLAWINPSVPGILGDKVVANVMFKIPSSASPNSLYYVKLDRVSGSPNGITLFPVRSGSGIVAMANRPTSLWNDGIPDAWRQQYFGTLNDPRSAADVDADGDGLSNYEEYKLGTSPTDAKDDLRIHAAANGRGVKIRFRTASGRNYRIEGSATLLPGSWITVQSNVSGTGNDVELPAPGGAHSFYYRVRLQE